MLILCKKKKKLFHVIQHQVTPVQYRLTQILYFFCHFKICSHATICLDTHMYAIFIKELWLFKLIYFINFH